MLTACSCTTCDYTKSKKQLSRRLRRVALRLTITWKTAFMPAKVLLLFQIPKLFESKYNVGPQNA